MKKYATAIARITVTCAILGCAPKHEQTLLPVSFAGDESSVPQGEMHADPPYPLRAITERPVDLAVWTREQAQQRVVVSDDRNPSGRKDLPWLAQFPEADAESEFNATTTPFWSAAAPAWAEVDLTRLCYVSQVIVEPYSTTHGVTEVSVSVIGADGIDVPVASNIGAPNNDETPKPTPATIVALFPPYVAQRVNIRFTRTGTSPDPNVYVRRIRILGVPVDGPFVARPAEIAEPLLKAMEANRQDLAIVTPDEPTVHIGPTGEWLPGSAAVPWIEDPAPDAYWAAPAPAAVTVDLGRLCYIDHVVVWPFSESYGATRFYVKAVTEDGEEVDTFPPADVTGAAVEAPGSGFRPPPLAVAFEPVAASKLRVYITDGGYKSDGIFVRRIQVLGVPALE